MDKLLTIGIPTFNRAQLLDKRLAWLSQEIKGFEHLLEIIVSDNNSTDHTMDVIEKWRPSFNSTKFIVNKHNKNLGVNLNCCYCINAATSKYVWTTGDNHKIEDKTLACVLESLSEHPDLTLLILNFSHRNAETNEFHYYRCFDIQEDEIHGGKFIVETWLDKLKIDLSFLPSLVYRTELAKIAVAQWPAGINNVDFLTYVSAYCALHGKVKLCKNTYIDYVLGNQNWYLNKKVLFRFLAKDVPEIIIKLIDIGYDKNLCRKNLKKQFMGLRPKFILGAMKRWPVYTIKVLSVSIFIILRSYVKSS